MLVKDPTGSWDHLQVDIILRYQIISGLKSWRGQSNPCHYSGSKNAVAHLGRLFVES